MAKPPKAITAPAQDNFDPAKLEEAGQAAQHLQQLQSSYEQGRDIANQLLGQAQMAGAFEEFSRTVRISKLAIVKETKAYRQLRGQISPHGAELAGTWEEYCALLNKSVDQVDRDIANLQAFGEEALEQMQRVGIGYRDLRQFRKLPADQKTALIEAAKAGDKDTLLELAEDLIAKHLKEKDELTKARDEATANYKSLEQVNEGQASKIRELQVKANKKVVADTDWPDALEPITDQIAAAGRAIAKAISDLETCRITLMETGQALEADLQPKYEAALGHVVEVYEAALAKAEREIFKERVTFDKSLGAYGTDAA